MAGSGGRLRQPSMGIVRAELTVLPHLAQVDAKYQVAMNLSCTVHGSVIPFRACPKMTHRHFLWRLYAAIGAAVFLFLLLAVFTILNFTRVNEAEQWTDQSYQVLVESIGLGESLANADTGARGFAITGQERFLAPLSAGRAEFPRHLHRVRRLTDAPTAHQAGSGDAGRPGT